MLITIIKLGPCDGYEPIEINLKNCNINSWLPRTLQSDEWRLKVRMGLSRTELTMKVILSAANNRTQIRMRHCRTSRRVCKYDDNASSRCRTGIENGACIYAVN